jgi:hypothetical protein
MRQLASPGRIRQRKADSTAVPAGRGLQEGAFSWRCVWPGDEWFAAYILLLS